MSLLALTLHRHASGEWGLWLLQAAEYLCMSALQFSADSLIRCAHKVASLFCCSKEGGMINCALHWKAGTGCEVKNSGDVPVIEMWFYDWLPHFKGWFLYVRFHSSIQTFNRTVENLTFFNSTGTIVKCIRTWFTQMLIVSMILLLSPNIS